MITKKSYRGDRNYNIKSISTILKKKNANRYVTYNVVTNHGKKKEEIWVLSGKDYVPGSKMKNRQMYYTPSTLPKSLKPIVSELKRKHKITRWK